MPNSKDKVEHAIRKGARSVVKHLAPTVSHRRVITKKALDGTAFNVVSHQVGVLNESPRWVRINPVGATPSAWSGNLQYVDFDIPQSIHVITNTLLELSITSTNNATILPPTPYWLDRYELFSGNGTTILETKHNHEIYHESIAFHKMEDDLRNTNALYHHGEEYSQDATELTVSGVNGKRFYVPLDTLLSQSKVFIPGFNQEFRLRVYFRASIHSAGAAPTLNNATLIVQDQHLSKPDYNNLFQAHKAGEVHYTFVAPDRHEEPLALTDNNTYTLKLSSHRSLSAGIIVYVGNQNMASGDELRRDPLQSFEMLDDMGNKMTETLQEEFIRSFIIPNQISTDFAHYKNLYLIPFSSSFGTSLKFGKQLGAEQLTTNEQIKINVGANSYSNTAKKVYVVSYNYHFLVCKGGNVEVEQS